MSRHDRRSFLAAASLGAAALSFSGVHSSLAAREPRSPNEKLRIAGVGCDGRGASNLSGMNGEEMTVLCDVDSARLEKQGAQYKPARTYRDFREMLDKESERIDAVVISTADHTHAPAAARALRAGLHVYCEKPLTHTVAEARKLAELARENKCVTQMGTQIHAGDNYRRVVELIRAGAIGKVREVHVFVGVNYSGAKFTTGTQAPASLDWDLWLGPAEARPYSEGVHPFNWRRFWQFGTGGLGDMGCHYIDLVHWALDLRHPTRISAQGSPVDPVSCPQWVVAEWEYPARGEAPPVKVVWYDGGRRPEILNTLKRRDRSPVGYGNGQLFIGDGGMLLSDYSRHLLLPEEKFADYQRPPKSIESSIGHHQEWRAAIRGGTQPTCNFDYAGALTETVLLGTVAYRAGTPLEWDAAQLRVTNSPEAQPLISKEYRRGWEV